MLTELRFATYCNVSYTWDGSAQFIAEFYDVIVKNTFDALGISQIEPGKSLEPYYIFCFMKRIAVEWGAFTTLEA